MVVPKTPENAPNTKYKIPISLWLVENSHLDIKLYALDVEEEISEDELSDNTDERPLSNFFFKI